MTIPFLDLKSQFEGLRGEVMAAVERTFDSCQFVLGREVSAFEGEFAAYCGVDHAVGVNSGTSALHLALLAAGVGPGDEVITVGCTFVATVAAVEYTGARPVLVDVDERSLTIDVDQIETAVTERTKAILPVHLHGHPADMNPILEIARERGLVVIEDAAQAHGAEYKSRRAGGIGHLGCFSFYPGKNLGAYGEGGAVTTNDEALDRSLRMLRDWGQARKYHHDLKGFNYRLDGVQGAVLRVKLRYLNRWNTARRRVAARYNELLAGSAVQLPRASADVRHVYHVYAIRTPQRDALRKKLQEQGIQSGIHYPIPVHLQDAYANLGYARGDLPVTEKACAELLSLPMYAELSNEQVEIVSRVITDSESRPR